MSYCRWSSDFFECDVYVYESSSGFETHVAVRRRKRKVPDEIKAMFPAAGDELWAEKYMAYEAAEKAWVKTLAHCVLPNGPVQLDDSEYVSLIAIGQEAGGSYRDSTPGECADRLESLRAKGFNVPGYAIVALREEQADDVAKEAT